MPDRPGAAVSVLIVHEQKLLLLKRQGSLGHGCWAPPGGHLEFGESLEACARRETLEETGLEIGEIVFQGITNDIFRVEEKHYITLWVAGTYLSGKPSITSPRENTEIGWFAPDALPQTAFYPWQLFLTGQTAPRNAGQAFFAQFFSSTLQ